MNDLSNIQDGINKLQDVCLSKIEVGEYGGVPIFAKSDINGQLYFVCLEFRPDGETVFLTAARTTEKMFEIYKKEHGSERSINLGDLTTDSNRALSISNIQKLLGIVKNGNTLNQMAGENAKTAALDKLEQAKAMAGDKTPEDIYKATGWFKGQDGKWRFEIPDNLEAISLDKLLNDKRAKLGEIYDNPQLFEAYPDLKDGITPADAGKTMKKNMNANEV